MNSKSIASLFGIALTFFLGCSMAQTKMPPSQAPLAEIQFDSESLNSPEKMQAPYVVLISIDGYRHDFNTLHKAQNLTDLANSGVQAKSLQPIYPSKTFPNHYSIITGDYADHNGIVSNDFYDPVRKASYSIGDKLSVADGSWYLTPPLWNLAEDQGLRTASFFWVGAEAAINGRHPNYYFKYDETVSNHRRSEKVLEWLQLPPEKRPHFITLYYSVVDTAEHHFGPEAPEVTAAVQEVDQEIGFLRSEFKKTGLPINMIIVSDHGMEKLDPSKVVLLDDSTETALLFKSFQVYGRGPQMQLYLKDGESKMRIGELRRSLRAYSAVHSNSFQVFTRAEMKSWHYSRLPRVGDLVIVPKLPWSVALKASPPVTLGGNHGWDPREPDMQGIFFAEGPAFKAHTVLPTFENVSIEPMMALILGIKNTSPVDGKLGPVKAALN